MTRHSSASVREQTPHATNLSADAVASHTHEANDDHSHKKKIEALAELICCAGDQSAPALFVLMGTIENSVDPKAVANTVKYIAFAQCAELNLYGIVDAQIAVVESALFA